RTPMSTRKITQVIQGQPASDGAGVKLIRSLGSADHLRLDPFLMLDAFSSENPDDYVAGFPSHPHRGFETVTYLLDGHMQHENGRMRGFQLWINLPAKEKMKPAGYRDIQPDEIPAVSIDGGKIKIVAGTYDGTRGPVQGGSTDPLYWDVQLNAGKTFSAQVPDTHSTYVYPFEGTVEIADRILKTHQGGALGSGDTVQVKAGPEGA